MPSSASPALPRPREWFGLEGILKIISFQPPGPDHTLPHGVQQLLGLPDVPLGVQNAGNAFTLPSLRPHGTKERELRAEQEIPWRFQGWIPTPWQTGRANAAAKPPLSPCFGVLGAVCACLQVFTPSIYNLEQLKSPRSRCQQIFAGTMFQNSELWGSCQAVCAIF